MIRPCHGLAEPFIILCLFFLHKTEKIALENQKAVFIPVVKAVTVSVGGDGMQSHISQSVF